MARATEASMRRLAAALALSIASFAQAAPILVSAGETVLFNFDFSGKTPAAPYELMQVDTGLSQWDPMLDDGRWRLFEGLNGTGNFTDDVLPSVSFAWSNPLASAGFLDGLFSVQLQVTAGEVSVDPWAFGVLWADTRPWPRVEGVVPVASVPEPSSAALLVLAMALAGVRARRGA